ncbi:MAG: DUF2934 domain-containing protein [Bryobacterales bacterium]|nr:DUF2934 domain-containing protein [Bryobacterales bacterium]MBV9396558.1 DUF2934 domain-containing protein [Bryobacterales bacterium]
MSSKAQALLVPNYEQTRHTELFADADIAPLAYSYWQQRGCPDGSPQEDWFRAQQELIARRRHKEASHTPA